MTRPPWMESIREDRHARSVARALQRALHETRRANEGIRLSESSPRMIRARSNAQQRAEEKAAQRASGQEHNDTVLSARRTYAMNLRDALTQAGWSIVDLNEEIGGNETDFGRIESFLKGNGRVKLNADVHHAMMKAFEGWNASAPAQEIAAETLQAMRDHGEAASSTLIRVGRRHRGDEIVLR